jgi:hypothetical protein
MKLERGVHAMNRIPPAWFLFFFAPLTVEYVSGSSPYLNPFVLLANLLLYGPGALLIRELRVRWRKGWLAVFILAVAYVVAEEGLMLNTLFDPTKNTTGRLWGVNWVWTAGMVVVHSLVSIFAPILLTEAIYHEKANEVWVKPGTLYILLAAFSANVLGLGRLIAPAHRPGAIYWLAEAAIIGGCLWLAHRVLASEPATSELKPYHSARWLYVASLSGMLITMIVGFAAPALPMPGAVKVVVMLAVYLGFLGFLHRCRAFDPGLDPLSRFAVACGVISFWVLAAPLGALAKGNVGPVIFAVLTAGLLASAHKRLKTGLARL